MNILHNYQRYIQSLKPNSVDGMGEESDKVGKYTVFPLVSGAPYPTT